MSRTLSGIFIFFIVGILEAQQPSVQSHPTPDVIHVSEGPGNAFKFTKADNTLWAEAEAADALYEERGLVLHNPDLQAFLDSVGRRLLGQRPVPERVTYRFLVFRDPAANAFALPNGTVYITTGLLALLENEAQLAGVLGHETAHIYERHPYLENRNIRKKYVASEIISLAAACVPGSYVTLLATTAASNLSTLILVESVYGYSREMESQADQEGLAAMTVAGYDPHAMAAAFDLQDQDRTLEYEPSRTFFHDHPSLIVRRQEALVFAGSHTPARALTGLKKEYLASVAIAIESSISADIESRRSRTAVALASRLADAFPSDPKYQLLLGESYRALGAKTALPTPGDLTPDGGDRERNRVLKMTEQQEKDALLKTPEGHATLKQNQAKAEKAFLGAIESDPQYALAYRELGFLYQDESRFADAAINYRHYLQRVSETSLDRLRIARRLAEVERLQAAAPL